MQKSVYQLTSAKSNQANSLRKNPADQGVLRGFVSEFKGIENLLQQIPAITQEEVEQQ